MAVARQTLGEHRDALRIFWDESVAAAPLPAADWAKGHVVTPVMWAQIDRFMEDAVLRGSDAPRYEPPPNPQQGGDARGWLARRGTVKALQRGRNLEVG